MNQALTPWLLGALTVVFLALLCVAIYVTVMLVLLDRQLVLLKNQRLLLDQMIETAQAALTTRQFQSRRVKHQ